MRHAPLLHVHCTCQTESCVRMDSPPRASSQGLPFLIGVSLPALACRCVLPYCCAMQSSLLGAACWYLALLEIPLAYIWGTPFLNQRKKGGASLKLMVVLRSTPGIYRGDPSTWGDMYVPVQGTHTWPHPGPGLPPRGHLIPTTHPTPPLVRLLGAAHLVGLCLPTHL